MKKLLKMFLIDFLYFLLTTIVIIAGKLKITQMYLSLQEYGPQLDTLNLDNDVALAQTLLSQINNSATEISLYLFIVIPLIAFILYGTFQGYSYYSLHKKKNFLMKFILASLVSLIFLVLLIFKFHYDLVALFVISSYLTFFLYFKELKNIKLALNKVHIYFPYFLVYFILFFLPLTAFFMTDASYGVGNLFYWYFIFGIILTILFSTYKIYLIKKLS